MQNSDVISPTHDSAVAPSEIAVGVIIGRASEYFDFFVYAIASVLVFPKVFFPGHSPLSGTLYAFLIFSFAFVARPIGTAVFMWVQKRFGREIKLTLALLVLGVSTAGIAFLPGYEALGFVSIVMLSLFRIGQGIALGGSWDGLPSLLALNAPARKRGWYAMLGQLGAPLGFAIAAGLFSYLLASLSSKDFLEWGWRYPFYVAFAINVVALFARLRLVSTDEYSRLLEQRDLQPASITGLLRIHSKTLIIGALTGLASYALFHVVTVFPLSWIALYSQRSISDVLVIQVIGASLGAAGIVISGLLADRFGRRIILGALACLIAAFSLCVPWLLNGSGNTGQNTFILVGFTLLGLSYGQASGVVTSNFLRSYRYTGAALTSDLTWLVGAGFAPLVALWLSTQFGLISVTFYLLSGVICTLAALLINRAKSS